MKRYINLLLLVTCMEVVFPLPFYVDTAARTGIDPIKPLIFFCVLVLMSLLITLILRIQIKEKTAELEARNKELARQVEDLQSMTNGIIAMAELILTTGTTKEQEENLERVKQSANSLLASINGKTAVFQKGLSDP